MSRSSARLRGARFATALTLAACGGQVASETDGGTDAAADTGTVDTAIDTAVETVVPPRSPGTCTGGGASIPCGPGLTCTSASDRWPAPTARADRPGGRAGSCAVM
ncbi:MAG: hypothetical protein IPJ34_11030 [Myxococcales bacterium]|nr:hypothetical protein [Myxococcales bacterium]